MPRLSVQRLFDERRTRTAQIALGVFGAKLEQTIHTRSAGRFFGRRTFGDRVPFSALLVVAVIGLLVIGYVLWSSQTGSLKMDKRGGETKGSSEIVPKP